MPTFYGTFPQRDELKKNMFVKIEAENYSEAHKEMFRKFGEKWAFLYTQENFEVQIEYFGLTEYVEQEVVMTVSEALAAAQTAKSIKLGGQYPTTAIVLSDEVFRLRALLASCLPAIEQAMQAEKIMNLKDKPFHELFGNVMENLK